MRLSLLLPALRALNSADAFPTKPIDFAIVRDEIDMRIGHAA
jgi:hypothetical protein